MASIVFSRSLFRGSFCGFSTNKQLCSVDIGSRLIVQAQVNYCWIVATLFGFSIVILLCRCTVSLKADLETNRGQALFWSWSREHWKPLPTQRENIKVVCKESFPTIS